MGKRILGIGAVVVLLGLSLVLVGQLFSESEPILAKVGEIVLTQKDLDGLMSRFEQMRKGKPYTLDEKKQMLDNLINGSLITLEAEKEKLDQSPEVQSKLKIYRDDLLIQEYIKKKIEPSITVTDKEVEEIMKGTPNLLPKETLTLKEILVKTEKEAEEIYKELKQGGNFSVIAGDRSKATSRVTGGLRRPVTRGQLPKALEEVAFNMKQGELSKPIKTDHGYYILYLEQRKERTPEEMKKLEDMIKEKVKKIEIIKKSQEMLGKKVEELKKNTKIEVHYDRIQ